MNTFMRNTLWALLVVLCVIAGGVVLGLMTLLIPETR